MYPVSEAYKAAIRAPVRTERITGHIALTDGGTLDFTDADLMSGSVTLDDQCVSGQELQFGCVYLGQASLRLKTGLDRYRLYGASIALQYGLLLPDGSWETLPLGVYTVAEAERTSVYVAIKAYDKLLALDAVLGAEVLRGTPYAILCRIAEKCGLAVGMSEAELAAFCNSDAEYQLSADDGCDTYRDCLGALAQILAGFGAVDGTGALCIRQFAAAPCATLAQSARQSATVADYTCGYVGLVVETQDAAYASYDPDENATGLTMTMEDVPLFGKGLPTRLQQMADAMFAVLQTIRYVPATVLMPGDPALRCGDRVLLEAPGGEGGAAAECLVTHRIFKFRGRQTLKGVGKNPYLAGGKSKDAAIIRKLQAQTSENKLIFYSFSNTAAIVADSPETEAPAGSINFVATQNTSAIFLGQLLLTATPKTESVTLPATDAAGTALSLTVAQDSAVVLNVRYYLNGYFVGNFVPQHTLPRGPNAIALVYPFASVLANTNNRFAVRLTVSGGSVQVAKGDFRATITGQGMAGGKIWDGTVTAEETVTPLHWAAPSAIRLAEVRDTVQGMRFHTPEAAAGAETLQMLRWTPRPITPGLLTEALTLHNVITNWVLAAGRNLPQYSAEYLTQNEAGAWVLRRAYTVQSVPQQIDTGSLSVLTPDFARFESVEKVVIRFG